MHFKFSPSILSRLGEELIPNPDQGILELVKNSYDADATVCEIELLNTEEIGGSIVISDNGMGMDLETLQSGWLVIGKSEKEGASDRTPVNNRLRVGSKGLGRLAALRHGSHVELITRPKSEPNTEYAVSVCWDDFDTVDSVEDVSLSPTVKQTTSGHGTTTIISNLKVKIGKLEINRLARGLLLLADPFETNISFRPRLLGTGFTDIEKQVNEQFFDDAEFFLKASLDENGYASAQLFDRKGSIIASASHSDISKHRKQIDITVRSPDEENLSTDRPYQKSVPANFELWIFQLNPQSFSPLDRHHLPKIRHWLEAVGGVHLYHRGLRVAPYGDKGDDWLKINFSRSRNPQVRPSNSTVIGRIIAEDSNSQLLQKTDRLGFLESETFLNLQQFAMNTLEWVADFRLQTVEVKQEQVKREIKPKIAEAKKNIEDIITTYIPDPKPKEETLLAFKGYDDIREEEVDILNVELQLYRSLATAGTTAAIFAHESGREINTLKGQVGILNAKMQKYIENEIYIKYFAKTFTTIQQLAASVQGFAKYPIYLLKKEKRTKGNVEIHQVINDVISLFDPFLESSNTTIELDRVNTELNLRGSTALVEAILINLITNAINAFNAKDAPIQNRKILIRTESSEKFIWLRVMDNALGIQGLTIDEIWLAGKTTTRSGTGLGLKIAKDSVIDLGGQISAIANGQLGGAEFIVQLPLK
ncbi:ATP-binding protein [Pseudanabaena galeata UHCC 0370]|uniref:histidine kinase n=1 Tax=Pseudanabaena galeata UHCC 0370 TaxID=3110310 RepID=A0ABU5TF26_9CYAN|nr:ATP-binding protein [Pseudanabaena galeata]MEA5476855.1 ATP-binding protein [Pseudanabaena galeata UHCC 0370]